MKYTLLFLITFLTTCDKLDDGLICTDQFVYGLNVIVKDASTNDIIVEGLTITATDGEYEEELMNFPNSTNYVGAGERPGNYIITVTSPHYQAYSSQTIAVGADECHVVPEIVEIFLQAN